MLLPCICIFLGRTQEPEAQETEGCAIYRQRQLAIVCRQLVNNMSRAFSDDQGSSQL